MKLIQYNIQGKEINSFPSLEQASAVLGQPVYVLSRAIKYGYRLDDGTCIKKLKELDQTLMAFREHLRYGTLRPKLERKYKVNSERLKRLIDKHQEEQTLYKAFKFWEANCNAPGISIRDVAELYEISLNKLSKYIEHEIKRK